MEELITENKLLVNQLALAALKRAKFSPDPDMLYCLQAAKWALDRDFLDFWKQVKYQLGGNLDAMLYRTDPADAMLFLEGEHDLMADFENMNPDAIEMGYVVLNQLHSRLRATMLGYPV